MGDYKFQSLYVYQLALDYIDLIYETAANLPDGEKYNLRTQIIRAATSIALNIAEGSTGQSDKEQVQFLSLAFRSFLETVACLDLIERRGYMSDDDLGGIRKFGRTLFFKITKFFKKYCNKFFIGTVPLDSHSNS